MVTYCYKKLKRLTELLDYEAHSKDYVEYNKN